MIENLLFKIVFQSLKDNLKRQQFSNLKRQQLQRKLVDNNSSNNEVFSTSSRVLYWDLVRRIETILTSKRKYKKLFPTTGLPWQEIYLLPSCRCCYRYPEKIKWPKTVIS